MSGRAHQGTVFQPLGEDDPKHVAGYKIAARLGAGGMGKVYLSYTPGGRAVAIKVIRPDFGQDAEFRRRFAQEVQAAQRVQGLFTAPVIDADADAEQPWLATAYVPGPSLADAVAQHGKLPVDTVLLLVAGIAEALQIIHGAGIVHRDLKPANVLLAADGPRVIDFGIARAADATSLTSSGVTIGTPSFMAPEQAAGSHVTPATDIFALGQITAYAATGRAAFGEGTSHGVLYRIVHEQPDLTDLPEQLRELVTRCMVKEPEGRPSVAEILSICQTANGETVLRRPEEWLPSVVAAEISTRKAAPAPPATPASGQPPVAAPAAPAAPAPAHAPTAHAAPQTPPPGFGPAPQPQQPGAHQQPPVQPQPPAAHQQPPAQPTYGYPQAAQPAPGYGYPQTAPHPQHHTAPQPYGTVASPVPAATPPKKKNKARNLAIAALVTLIVGGAAGGGAYLALSDRDKDKTNQSQGKGDPSAGTTPKETTPSGDATPGADGDGLDTAPGDAVPAPEPKTYTGLNIVNNYHIFLDHDPIKPLDDDSNADFEYEGDLSQVETESGRMILLGSGQAGDLDTCRNDTRYTTTIEMGLLSKGSQICVLTDSGHVGLVTYQGKSSENDASRFITVDVTVWRNAMDPVPSS
ncbi:serine/threonine-protein kinase [Streptomyces xantholiticus]|uniref:serine/threonine-protein kinase n=1 Tax=Streptomyces xantholiticus TaxID=68285 RepID=UPI001673D737|nr:serine/threonine-protein kinase [Streptomyces xantholiticus]